MSARTRIDGEELANAATHGVGLAASIAAIPVLVIASTRAHDAWQIAGSAVFGATLVLLYLASTLYHLVREGSAKRILRAVDHSAIYLLIAGSYTPFTLGVLRGPWGWTLLSLVWTIALFGVIAKWTVGFRFPRLSTVLYLVMGWLVVIAAGPLVSRMSPAGLAWLAAGGLCYTGGVVFYVYDRRIPFGHAIWHLFVLAGSTCHFFAVLGHAATRGG